MTTVGRQPRASRRRRSALTRASATAMSGSSATRQTAIVASGACGRWARATKASISACSLPVSLVVSAGTVWYPAATPPATAKSSGSGTSPANHAERVRRSIQPAANANSEYQTRDAEETGRGVPAKWHRRPSFRRPVFRPDRCPANGCCGGYICRRIRARLNDAGIVECRSARLCTSGLRQTCCHFSALTWLRVGGLSRCRRRSSRRAEC